MSDLLDPVFMVQFDKEFKKLFPPPKGRPKAERRAYTAWDADDEEVLENMR